MKINLYKIFGYEWRSNHVKCRCKKKSPHQTDNGVCEYCGNPFI